MSLVNLTDYKITQALTGGNREVAFMTTTEYALQCQESIQKADVHFKKGNWTGAMNEFYAAYAPSAEEDEKAYVLHYLQALSEGSKLSQSKQHQDLQCVVFGQCGDNDPDKERIDVILQEYANRPRAFFNKTST